MRFGLLGRPLGPSELWKRPSIWQTASIITISGSILHKFQAKSSPYSNCWSTHHRGQFWRLAHIGAEPFFCFLALQRLTHCSSAWTYLPTARDWVIRHGEPACSGPLLASNKRLSWCWPILMRSEERRVG